MNEPPNRSPKAADSEGLLREMNEALLVASVHQHESAEQARKAEAALRESEERLAAELGATQRLQEISIQLIHEDKPEALYEQILDAAIAVMQSDMASIRIVDPGQGALRMLARRGFDPAVGDIFALDRFDAETAWGVARRVGHRVIVPDVETCDFIVGTAALDEHRRAGIRAVQSTPLVSRSGRVLGTISTHWRRPHQPLERDLRLMDLLARQAADLLEHSLAEAALRESEQRYRTIVDQVRDYAIFSTDVQGRATTWNQGVEKILGFDEPGFIGKDIRKSIFTPEDFEAGVPQRELDEAAKFGAASHDRWMRRKSGERFFAHGVTSAQHDAAGRLIGFTQVMRDHTERKQAEEHRKLLLREISHRAKNLLAVVQSVARQTASDEAAKSFVLRFSTRLSGLAASLDLLVQNKWKGVDVADLVRAQLSHFSDLIGSRITMNGPGVIISAATAQTLGMALLELATNAAKYGALSSEKGTVNVSWKMSTDGGLPRYHMSWHECGGPVVAKPDRLGFGHTVMVRMVEHALDAQVAIEYAGAGLHWQMSAPAAAVVETAKGGGEGAFEA